VQLYSSASGQGTLSPLCCFACACALFFLENVEVHSYSVANRQGKLTTSCFFPCSVALLFLVKVELQLYSAASGHGKRMIVINSRRPARRADRGGDAGAKTRRKIKSVRRPARMKVIARSRQRDRRVGRPAREGQSKVGTGGQERG
jgi:hypothetical protein